MNNDLDNFVAILTSMGNDVLEFLLYGVRAVGSLGFEEVDLSLWPTGSTVRRFEMYDEGWPIIIELFEIQTPHLPVEYDEVLKSGLASLILQGATLSWYMFEGAFGDVPNLFIPWQVENTYGICLPGPQLYLALTDTSRKEKAWHEVMNQAAAYLHTNFPDLNSL
jgi:hypothetical protein